MGWKCNVGYFASLVTTDKQSKPIPDLAEKWDISADQLTYTFHLRKNLKFSDGSPLTADDVAFTLTLLHDKAYEGGLILLSMLLKVGKNIKKEKQLLLKESKLLIHRQLKLQLKS